MPREKDFGPGDLGPPWTVLKMLRWTSQFFEQKDVTDTPRLDADLLLGHVMDLERVQLYTKTDELVPDDERTEFRALVKRRAAGEPVAYLVGRRSFWQLELHCDDRALVPRPDTEVLVEVALETLPEDEELRVADIGTGTGAVALALASERPAWDIAATDDDAEALSLARENVEATELDEHVYLYQGDLLEAVPEPWLPLDAVISNPPYVADEDPDVEIPVRKHEPAEALFAGPDGLGVIRRLVPAAFEALAPGGWLMLEHGHRQGSPVRELLQEAGFEAVETRQDYGERDRVTLGQRPD